MGRTVRLAKALVLWGLAFGSVLLGAYSGATSPPASAWPWIAPLAGFAGYLLFSRAAIRIARPDWDEVWRSQGLSSSDFERRLGSNGKEPQRSS
ncbi:MAG TPA: hypothetical protein VGR00_00225 [Thermoanaerobaculia bacterium]|nr:hypothetical protein [Thermoanaerobaculia bacterium]